MIQEYKGCSIEHNEKEDCFVAYRNGEIFVRNPSMAHLKGQIDMLLKKEFERLPIYWKDDEEEIIEGEITSFNSIEKEVWVSYGKDKQREKVNLKYYGEKIIKKTKENLTILQEIKKVCKELSQLEKRKEKLSATLDLYTYAELCEISRQPKIDD